MGTIKLETIKGTIFTYLGAAIGLINTGLLIPRILSTEQVGFINYVIAYVIVVAQIGSLGFNSTTTRLFPYFRNDEKKHHGFLGLALLVSFTGFLLGILYFLLFKDQIVTVDDQKSDLISSHFFYFIPLLFFTILFNTFDHYSKVLYKASIGIFLKDFLQKIIITGILILLCLKLIDFREFTVLYFITFFFPGLFLAYYLFKENELSFRLDFSFISQDLWKSIGSVSFFGILTSATGIIVVNIDKLMIKSMISLEDLGIYSISFFIGMVVALPAKSLNKISSTYIAEAWKSSDMNLIEDLYCRSSSTQALFGILIFVGIVLNTDLIFYLITDVYRPGYWVIIIIGFAYLFDMFSGVSNAIISNSPQYKVLAVLLVIMTLFVIVGNYLLIPKYGIIGAAISSLFAKFEFNFSRYLFILKRFKIQPYNFKFLIILLSGGISFILVYLIPKLDNVVLNSLIQSVLFVLLYLSINYWLKTSLDFNSLINNVFGKIGIHKTK